MIIEHPHPVMGVVKTVGAGLGFPQSSYAKLPPPELGEHSISILEEALQYTPSQIEILVQKEVIIDPAREIGV